MPFSACRDVLARVSDILDGEAGLPARLRFHGHLAMCDRCRDYYRQFRDVRAAAGVVLPEDVPADFDEVMGAVLRATQKSSVDQVGRPTRAPGHRRR